ncbi:MAG: helix-turn-helix transcriptional regulator, partial [Gordonia sp. (in: high G+C Gram-positive bacteria)]
ANGSALTAATRAEEFAARTGADTPALRALRMPAVLTPRQLELVSLAAAGLSNKAIADRLGVSVRSVEGHFLRASQRVDVHSREELIALVAGRGPVN